MCDFTNHKLIDLYRNGYSHETSVVRWCQDCGAVVIDTDADGRTYPGRIMKIKLPKNAKDLKNNPTPIEIHGGLSVCKMNLEDCNTETLYNNIPTMEEAVLLSQLAMCNKENHELIYILPGWNRGIDTRSPEEYTRALELANKYIDQRESGDVKCR
jgi:hypothetical protein